MKLGTIEIYDREKATGFLPVMGCGYSLPMTVLKNGEGPTILVTAGIHNAEYVGIQAAIELSRELRPEQIAGTLIIIPLVNVSGFPRRTMSLVYEDGKNLNREFPGKMEGTVGDKICYTIAQKLFPCIDAYIDLHSGDGYEELMDYVYVVEPVEPQVLQTSMAMAEQVDCSVIVKSQWTKGGAYNYASACGIPSVLIERGGMGTWSRSQVDRDKGDVRRILARLGLLQQGQPLPLKRKRTIFRTVLYENAPVAGCWYPCFHPGDRVKAGDTLGEIRDYFGQTVIRCKAQGDGMVLYQTGSLSIVQDGPMVAYGLF